MNFSDLIKERFSCRSFKSIKVEQEKIDKILEAAQAAPTAVNKQPFRILVLTDKERLLNLKECTKYDFDAPLCFMICTDKSLAYSRGYDQKNSADIDGSIAVTHMMLQAHELGLGTTWVMAFDPDKAREIFNVPENFEILAFLPTGYPADDVKISPLHTKRITIEEMVKYNSFD
ncbi:MAG: nitroreductase family protein [Acetobacter sp.]|nr:nitroreductase family protein [Bacteroides sp.]MCM1340497.1 nitroreductase family protein [Acetobacter sp.]MCM1433237.1 nitroreductase family protein [Clostridiales bacterium]